MLRNKYYSYGDEMLEVPAHMHFGKEMFDRMLQYKDIVALINSDTSEQVTYAELANQTANIALSLTRYGVRKGDVISICSEKGFEMISTVLGIACAGAIYSPTIIIHGATHLLNRANIVKPKIMFCSLEAYETHKNAFHSVGSIERYILFGNERRDGTILFHEFVTERPCVEDFLPTPVNGWEDIAFIIFSSGTTGLPKGVPLTHLNLLSNCRPFGNGACIGKRMLSTREWYFTYGLMNTFCFMNAGATVIFSQRNQVEDCLSAIQTYKVHSIQLCPSSLMGIINNPDFEKYDLSSLETIMSSGAPLLTEHIKTVKDKMPYLVNITSAYGSSEAGCMTSYAKATKGIRFGSSGVPSPGFIIKVVDIDSREPLGANQRGEICFKSPSLMKGYINCDVTNYIDEEGFFKSGDIGYYDQDRYFYVVDRIKELIKYNSCQVIPAELEAILMNHPAVRQAGVVGAPHDVCGELPTAFVVLKQGADVTPQCLIDYFDAQVSIGMRLAGGVRIVPSLPYCGGSKLDRKTLKLML